MLSSAFTQETAAASDAPSGRGRRRTSCRCSRTLLKWVMPAGAGGFHHVAHDAIEPVRPATAETVGRNVAAFRNVRVGGHKPNDSAVGSAGGQRPGLFSSFSPAWLEVRIAYAVAHLQVIVNEISIAGSNSDCRCASRFRPHTTSEPQGRTLTTAARPARCAPKPASRSLPATRSRPLSQ